MNAADFFARCSERTEINGFPKHILWIEIRCLVNMSKKLGQLFTCIHHHMSLPFGFFKITNWTWNSICLHCFEQIAVVVQASTFCQGVLSEQVCMILSWWNYLRLSKKCSLCGKFSANWYHPLMKGLTLEIFNKIIKLIRFLFFLFTSCGLGCLDMWTWTREAEKKLTQVFSNTVLKFEANKSKVFIFISCSLGLFFS